MLSMQSNKQRASLRLILSDLHLSLRNSSSENRSLTARSSELLGSVDFDGDGDEGSFLEFEVVRFRK